MADTDGIKEAKDVLYGQTAKNGGIFPQGFKFAGLGNEKQAGADI